MCAYFNHAFKKTFVATKPTQASSGSAKEITDGILTETGVHVSALKDSAAPYSLGVGVVGMFDAKTNLSTDAAAIATDCCPFYLGGAAIKLSDKQGPFHGGYQESNKSKILNTKYIRKTWKVEGNAASAAFIQVGGTPDNISGDAACDKEFLCGETYYLRIDVKGTPALRFANHNLYRTLDASGGCCADPSNPVAVDDSVIYLQWATQIAEDQFFKDFIRPVLVVNGQSYAYNEADAIALGLDPATELFSDAPVASGGPSGMILIGAYVDTQFQDCTFQTSDYYGIEPIQIFASEVDLNGDPCTFNGVCVVESCPGVQANGSGEQKVRDLILSESYLQNFMATDLRIREITQGTAAYDVLSRTSLYSSFYILHSVPRFNNPSGTFDNDQYILEVVGNDGTLTYLESEFDALDTAGCTSCQSTEDFTAVGCVAPAIPNP